jgi:hypothetical protein
MPSKPSRTGSSNLFGERQPLLKQHTVDTLVTVRSELEAASQNGSGTHGAWKVFFFLICSICLNAVIAFIANENGEGDETNYLPPSQSSQLESPRFDYKWALWRALGGGLTGAIGANVLSLRMFRVSYPRGRAFSGTDTSRNLDGGPLLMYTFIPPHTCFLAPPYHVEPSAS